MPEDSAFMFDIRKIFAAHDLTSSLANLEVKGKTKTSNDTRDNVKVKCRIENCGRKYPLTYFRGHTRHFHKMPVNDYKKIYGEPKNHIVEKVYHRCGLCAKLVLFDSDIISGHLRACHKEFTHSEYNARFMILQGTSSALKASIKEENEFIKLKLPKKIND